MSWLFIWFTAIIINKISSEKIEEKVVKYFDSDIYKTFQLEWNKHRKSYENAFLLALKEGYGTKGMNIYVKKPEDALMISKGYYHFDNQVQIIFSDMNLEALPHMWMPEVSISLASHRMRVTANLSKMIIHTSYMTFRNTSDIIYSLKDQDPYKDSPFRFEQVKNTGQLTILVDGCVLYGMTVAKLNGHSVDLGLNTFSLAKCLFVFEISSPGSGSPPVIARYSPDGEGLNIEHLLMNTLRQELMPKLQAAMYTYINTTAIFGKQLPEIRHEQNKIFEETSLYLNDVIRTFMKITNERNLESIEMDDFNIYYNDTFKGEPKDNVISLTNMVLSGLETAYSAHIGGPYKVFAMKIVEQIRFGCLQVRGNIRINEARVTDHDFAVEMHDVALDVTINVNLVQTKDENDGGEKFRPSKAVHKFEILGWRSLEYSVPKMDYAPAEALITGYFTKAIPNYVVQHIFELFNDVMNLKDNSGKRPETKQQGSSEDHDIRTGRNKKNKKRFIKTLSNKNHKLNYNHEDAYRASEENHKRQNKVKIEIQRPKSKFFSEPMFVDDNNGYEHNNKHQSNEEARDKSMSVEKPVKLTGTGQEHKGKVKIEIKKPKSKLFSEAMFAKVTNDTKLNNEHPKKEKDKPISVEKSAEFKKEFRRGQSEINQTNLRRRDKEYKSNLIKHNMFKPIYKPDNEIK